MNGSSLVEHPLTHFKFAQFQFILRALDIINLPLYKGSTLRGGFGNAFKKIVCVNREKVCDSCLLKGKCAYSYVFETPPPADTTRMRKYPFVPHPFIITPPLETDRNYRKGEKIQFELTLVGKSVDYLPYFIYTFDELGRMGIGRGRGAYQLEEVRTIETGQRFKATGERTEKIGERSKDKGIRFGDQCERARVKEEETSLIYSGKDKTLRNDFKVLTIEDIYPFNLSPLTFDLASDPLPLTLPLLFITPTRLKYDGKLTPTLEFHVLFRNLLRRISLLSYFHCGEELSLDFKGLIERAREIATAESDLKWFDWERYSGRQETRLKMGGFMGSVTFKGNFGPFLPFLLLGEYVHVGKGTSFGLGKYEILRTQES